ncbi:MAG TPA: AI-2E family transporter [Kouleothrix sp.]|uniref:AI-2E family transporter n=1 Tax=Kouleothrix sp. TaxID=2779161 RepID=UPI002BB89521|nr:AI-2E family transporter [Kouleothrix sp.]HRC77144.1 AI-2E family transporter [Kouleothrix sp.]
MLGDRLQRILVWMLIVAVSVYLLERLFFLTALFATPLLLFGLAWLASLVLKPLVDWLTMLTLPVPFVSHRAATGAVTPTWRLPRALAVSLVYVAIIALVVVLVVSLVPIIEPQLVGIDETLPNAVSQISLWITGLESELQRVGFRGNIARIAQPEALAQQATTLGSTLIQQSLGIASGIATLLIDLILVLILSYYMTLDGPRIADKFLQQLPEQWRDDTVRFFTIVNHTFGGFLRAQLIQGFIYGIATAMVMTGLGLDYVALASVIASIIVLVPIIGSVLGVIPPLVIAIIDRPDSVLLMVLVLAVVQQVLFNMIMPRLMGRIVGLHPLLVFAAILVGATVAGGWGILFGIPIAGVVAAVLQFIYGRTTIAPAPPAPPEPQAEPRSDPRPSAGDHRSI